MELLSAEDEDETLELDVEQPGNEQLVIVITVVELNSGVVELELIEDSELDELVMRELELTTVDDETNELDKIDELDEEITGFVILLVVRVEEWTEELLETEELNCDVVLDSETEDEELTTELDETELDDERDVDELEDTTLEELEIALEELELMEENVEEAGLRVVVESE